MSLWELAEMTWEEGKAFFLFFFEGFDLFLRGYCK